MITELQLHKSGFDRVKSYNHDQYNTNRYKKGKLEVEFTYEKEKVVDVGLTIQEINHVEINLTELIMLDEILNK